MKTAISVPDATFARVEEAAARLGVSRSEFFARAAERWMAELADRDTTAAIDEVLADTAEDATGARDTAEGRSGFAMEAARRTVAADDAW